MGSVTTAGPPEEILEEVSEFKFPSNKENGDFISLKQRIMLVAENICQSVPSAKKLSKCQLK